MKHSDLVVDESIVMNDEAQTIIGEEAMMTTDTNAGRIIAQNQIHVDSACVNQVGNIIPTSTDVNQAENATTISVVPNNSDSDYKSSEVDKSSEILSSETVLDEEVEIVDEDVDS